MAQFRAPVVTITPANNRPKITFNVRYQEGNVPNGDARGSRSGLTVRITVDGRIEDEAQNRAIRNVLSQLADKGDGEAVAPLTQGHPNWRGPQQPVNNTEEPARFNRTPARNTSSNPRNHQTHAPISREVTRQPATNRLREERKEYRESDRRKDQRKQNWRRDKRQ